MFLNNTYLRRNYENNNTLSGEKSYHKQTITQVAREMLGMCFERRINVLFKWHWPKLAI